MRTDLQFTHLTLVPGQPTRVAIEVTNTADVIDGVTAIIDGLDEDWIRLDQPLVRLFPDATGEVVFTIDVPESCPAGDYLVIVRIVSTISAERQSVQDFWVTVEPARAGRIEVVPQIVTKRSKAELLSTVTNTGNTPTTFQLSAVDATGEVDCQVDPAEVLVDVGESVDATVRMRGPRPWLGQVVSRSIMLTAVADELELSTIATFNQKPRISRGLITFLTLVAIVALWATMFVFVIGFIRNQDQPGKASATAIAGGEQAVPIGKIGAQASGTVTSSTQGAGVPRVAVQAYRIPPASNSEAQAAQGFRMRAADEPQLFAEAATDEDGNYSLASLLPGSYYLKFSAAGFGDQWYSSEAASTEPEPIELGPAAELASLDVVLVGDTGSFRGEIDQSGSEATAGNFVVTATLIDPDADPDSPPEPIQGTVNPDGTYELGDLPAPNDYLVRIEDLDGNYSTQEFVISVAAGEKKQLNPVVPSASVGQLSGVVVNGAGSPLGGVTVTVRNGEFEVEAVTPTTGATGSFRFIGLPTPATYIVTFSLEGFTGQTIALELGPGKTDDSLRPVLVGGLGTINGVVTDPGGNRLGAAAVLVEGNGFSAATATLTDPGSTGGIGSFFISSIPVPGSYTVTFNLEGFAAVTIPAQFGESGGALSPQVTLTPIAGRVTGVVTSAQGGPVSNVDVQLSSGLVTEDRSTISASAGEFSFTNVLPGAYTVQFSAAGFAPFVRLVEVDLGGVVNADAVMTPVAVPPPFVPAPSIEVVHEVDLATIDAPGTLTYSTTVTNTGNVGLTGVTVTNDLAGAAVVVSGDTNNNSIMETDEAWVFSATYLVVEADFAAGIDLVNTASVTTSEVSRPVTRTATTTVTQTPTLSVAQTVDPTGYSESGQELLTFTITVANTGNVGLTGVTVTNDLAGAATLDSGDLDGDSVLDLAEVWVYTATHQTFGSDYTLTALVNTASVVTTELPGPTIVTATSTHLFPPAP
jgi:uncharacterized repeat protein (TIGR01451 family)